MGVPLNPYVHARLVNYLLHKFAIRDLVRPPVDLFQQKGMSDFLEWSTLRSWMEEWLHYLHWYCSTALYII